MNAICTIIIVVVSPSVICICFLKPVLGQQLSCFVDNDVHIDIICVIITNEI